MSLTTLTGTPNGGAIPKPNATTQTQAGAEWTVVLPAGCAATVSSVSKQSYNQGVCAEYKRDTRQVRNLMGNARGTSNGDMYNLLHGATTIRISEVEEATTIALKWYQSQVPVPSKHALFQDASLSNNIAVTMTESEDEVVYIINVFDKSGRGAIPDQVTTLRHTKVVDTDPLGLSNIQGDVVPGLPKALEFFYYFQITDSARFKEAFKSFAYPHITTSEELVNNPPPPAKDNPDHPFVGFNVGFSSVGITHFGLNPQAIGDSAFVRGQQADAKALGDAGVQRGEAWSPEWDPEYKANIDGIFLVTAYNKANAEAFIAKLEAAFTWAPGRSSIHKVVSLYGYPRPGANGPNDHFGYRGGGMTNPHIKDVTFTEEKGLPFLGSPVIDLGIIVMGREGDEDQARRPEWAVDGSLIATRKLNNLVPEFDAYLLGEGPKVFPGMDAQKAADKLGARLMGRWKNGTPVELSPDHDAPEIAADPKRVNNFEFDQADVLQKGCPFAAHMRKSNPRNDVPVSERDKHLIRRHNMPYGPEVTDDERVNGTTQERGLHVVIYQSSIERGFRHIQTAWYNEPQFPPGKPTMPGWDPVFGQTGNENVHRFMSGVDPANPQKTTMFLDKFIDPRGGEYFFSPSMKTLRDHVCA